MSHKCGTDNPSAWGCHEETNRARWVLICPTCLGSGSHGGEVCTTCNGRKEIPQPRCPYHGLTNSMDEYLTYWKYFEQYKTWPSPNVGICEQPTLFLEVVDIMSSVKNYIDNRNEDKREKMRSLNGKGN